MTATAGAPAAWLARRVPPQRLVMAMFFLQAAALNNWFPRIPDVQAKLALSPGQLGIALLAMPAGGLIGTAAAARIVEAAGARRTLAFGYLVFGGALVLPGWAWSLPVLCAVMFFNGIAYVVGDVAANVEASRIQAATGRRILSTCHGFWSLGSMLGLAAGSAFAEWQVDVRLHLLIAVVVLAPLAFTVARSLPRLAPAPDEPGTRQPFAALPSVAMIPLCVFAFGAIVGELSIRNWGAVYLRDTIAASAAGAGVGYTAFSLFMALGRFGGDRLADRYGPVALGRACALLATVGLLALIFTPSLWLGVLGFAAMGAGVSVAMPLSVSTAANFGGRSAAVNVAALSLVAYAGSLAGPPLIGFVADAWGLRAGLASILPLVVLSAVFAGELGRQRRST